jgi:hypothetical protein
MKQICSGMCIKKWKCDQHSKPVVKFFISDNCGFPVKKYTITNIDKEGSSEERMIKFNNGLKHCLTLVQRVCHKFKIHFGSVMLSLQENIVHHIPGKIQSIMEMEQELAALELASQERMLPKDKKMLNSEIEAKKIVLIAARNETNVGQEIVNLHNQIKVLEGTLTKVRRQVPIANVAKISSLTVHIKLLQDSFNYSMAWLKRSQPEIAQHLQVPSSINIIDLSGSNWPDDEEQDHEEEVDDTNSTNNGIKQEGNIPIDNQGLALDIAATEISMRNHEEQEQEVVDEVTNSGNNEVNCYNNNTDSSQVLVPE